MSNFEKEEQIMLNNNANTDDKDNARNKSESSSPVSNHPQQEHRQPTRMVKSASQGSSPASGLQHSSTPEHMRGATKDMFDLIERVQCSRLDDQRCVLPTYLSQLPF